MANREQRIKAVRDKIGAIPDFPKPGINFRDIFPLFKEPALLNDLILLLVEHIKEKYEKVDVIVGLEARGFLFGPMIAQHLNASFVPIRKKGKLPGECVKVEYSLEYGTDVFEAQKNAVKSGEKVIIVDDLIATGVDGGIDELSAADGSMPPSTADSKLSMLHLLLIAGTMDAACQLIGGMGGDILECLVVIELVDLKGKAKLKKPFFTLVEFEGE